MNNEIQKLTDTIDLMRDEFRRIKACPADKWAKPEVDELCDRAIRQIEQTVPVIVQRDRAEAKVAELTGALIQSRDANCCIAYGATQVDAVERANRALGLSPNAEISHDRERKILP